MNILIRFFWKKLSEKTIKNALQKYLSCIETQLSQNVVNKLNPAVNLAHLVFAKAEIQSLKTVN